MSKRLYLIAGHRGKGTGAVGFIDEGAETIRLRDALCEYIGARYLPVGRQGGVELLTDKGRDGWALGRIVRWLRGSVRRDDICVDIHFNSSSNSRANGCEVFIPERHTRAEYGLALKLAFAVSRALGVVNRGVKSEVVSFHKRLAMLSGFDCVNLLLEVCFVSNRGDVEAYEKNFGALVSAVGDLLMERLAKW